MNARFKVSVTGEDGHSDDLVVDDCLLDGWVQRTGVTDTGCTAVANGLEAKLVEVGLQAGFLEVGSDNTGARAKAGLDGFPNCESALNSLLRNESSREHHGWVRCVRTAGDCSDNDVSIGDGGCLKGAVHFYSNDIGHWENGCSPRERWLVVGCRIGQHRGEGGFDLGQLDAILWTLWPGDTWDNGCEVKIVNL